MVLLQSPAHAGVCFVVVSLWRSWCLVFLVLVVFLSCMLVVTVLVVVVVIVVVVLGVLVVLVVAACRGRVVVVRPGVCGAWSFTVTGII